MSFFDEMNDATDARNGNFLNFVDQVTFRIEFKIGHRPSFSTHMARNKQ